MCKMFSEVRLLGLLGSRDFHVAKFYHQFSAFILLGISEALTIVIPPSCLTHMLHVASTSPDFPVLLLPQSPGLNVPDPPTL